MDYEIKEKSNRVIINIEEEYFKIEHLEVDAWYREKDDIYLLSHADEIQINKPRNAILRGMGYGELEIKLPESFIENLEEKLENSVQEKFT